MQMALRIEVTSGLSMDTLMQMQNSYGIGQARNKEGEITVKRFVPQDVPPRPSLL